MSIRALSAVLTVVALSGILSACASSPSGEGSSRDRNLIAAEEIQRSNSNDLHGLVTRHRPQWIGGRNSAAISLQPGEEIVVYFDRTRYGGPESLRGIPLDGVRSLRFLSGPDAQQRFGLDHRRGAIVVSFRPEG
jgi:hypothetical protein